MATNAPAETSSKAATAPSTAAAPQGSPAEQGAQGNSPFRSLLRKLQFAPAGGKRDVGESGTTAPANANGRRSVTPTFSTGTKAAAAEPPKGVTLPSATAAPTAAAAVAASAPGPTTRFEPGLRVRVEGYGEGCVRHAGPIRFTTQQGTVLVKHRVGVELDRPVGLNSGDVDGVTYFPCGHRRGVFVVPRKVTVLGGGDAAGDGPGGHRRRASDNKWETESVSSQFSFVSLATVHSIGSDLDDAAAAGKQSPASVKTCSSECGGEYVVLPAAAHC